MSEDVVQTIDTPEDLKAQHGSRQTQSGQIVDQTEILSKLGAVRQGRVDKIVISESGGGTFSLEAFPILGVDNRVGSFGNSSISISSILTTEVEWNEAFRTSQATLINGQYAVDYDEGLIAYNTGGTGTIFITYDTSSTTLLTQELTTRYVESGVNTYVGEAQVGASESDPVWRIKRINETSSPNFDIKWADGNASFDNVWSNYSSLTYS